MGLRAAAHRLPTPTPVVRHSRGWGHSLRVIHPFQGHLLKIEERLHLGGLRIVLVV